MLCFVCLSELILSLLVRCVRVDVATTRKVVVSSCDQMTAGPTSTALSIQHPASSIQHPSIHAVF